MAGVLEYLDARRRPLRLESLRLRANCGVTA
jgi:hypothetical protein